MIRSEMNEPRAHALARLSERQRQCLGRVAQGYTSKEIGRQLGLSPSTVDNHVRSALERLNMSDRSEAARLFRESQDTSALAATAAPLAIPTDFSSQSVFSLPPLGGRTNNLSVRRRVWHIVQIALIGIMGMTAAVITIAGLVNLFSRQ
jgi:DNA-binding CsgD family transcriptional regulator